MDWISIIATVSSVIVGVGGFILAWRRLRRDSAAGVVDDERTARRDTVADRDALIDRLAARLTQVEERLTAAEDGNVAKALTIRAQGDHIDVLEAHIWAGKAPPPPPRPTGI